MLALTPLLLTAQAATDDEPTYDLLDPVDLPGIVVWMEPEVPDAKVTKRADHRWTGGTGHVAWSWLQFPPQPATPEDDAVYEELRGAISEGKRRWTDFEVEYGIAVGMDEILGRLQLVRDDRDLDALVSARLFQGAAVHVAFEPAEFRDGDRAAPFRHVGIGDALNKPWMEAMALDAQRSYVRSDVADGASFPALQKAESVITALPQVTLKLPPLEDGMTMVLDGRVVERGLTELTIRPGRHYAHVLRQGRLLSGRTVMDLEAGSTSTFPILVDETELDAARSQVLAGTVTGFPEDVKKALRHLAWHVRAPIYVAALDENRVEILPYALGAELLANQPVTLVTAGELGSSLMVSKIFEEAEGAPRTAPGVHGDLSAELGIYYGALLAGFDVGVTPASSITHATQANDENVHTSVFYQPWGGIGGYVLRPTGYTPTFLIAMTWGWDYPAHMPFGGRLTFSLPIDLDVGGTWLRFTLGGKGAPKSMWDEGDDRTSLYTFYLRVGLGTLFF